MLIDDRTVLRAPQPGDLPVLTAIRNDVALQVQLMSLPRANSSERVKAWLTRLSDDPRALFFVIADRETDRTCGFVQLTEIDLVHGTAYLGIALAAGDEGRGHAGSALSLVETHARDVFNLRKILLQVRADNERAVAFYLKTGFTTVGTMREHHYHQGGYHDVQIMEKALRSTTSST